MASKMVAITNFLIWAKILFVRQVRQKTSLGIIPKTLLKPIAECENLINIVAKRYPNLKYGLVA